MLTPEEKQRIEDEERKRIVEEQYRAEVRAKLQKNDPLHEPLANDAAVTQQVAKQAEPKQKRRFGVALLQIGIILLAVLLAVFIKLVSIPDRNNPENASSGLSALPSLFQTPRSQKLLTGSVAVNAGSIWYLTFNTDPDHMSTIHINGRFHATGGMGNDIQAILCSEDEFQNLRNRHEFRSYYNSGKTTAGSVDVRLPASGRYVLAFNNRFALFSGKTVTGEIIMDYMAH